MVTETLGHSQISLTLDTYSHVLPGLLADAAKRLDEALAIGGRNGCQDDGELEGERQESPNSGKNLVSRGGIEPPTRRLRVGSRRRKR